MPDPRAFLAQLARQHAAQERRGPDVRASGSRLTQDEIVSRHSLAGASRDRLTQGWTPMSVAPNVVHQADAALLRGRARDLVDNNPFARSAVNAYVANVVECGITPKPNLSDREQRKTWSQEWEHFAGREADITRDQHFYELQALWLEEVIVGGGCLVNFRTLPRAKARNRRLPLALELIPEERFADDLDTVVGGARMRQAARDLGQREGTSIIRGVEVDDDTGEAVAYWVRKRLPNDLIPRPDDFRYVRLPREQCVYGFHKYRSGQTRGLTLLRTAILWLWKLGYYVDNELMNSALRSCFAAMIKTNIAAETEWLGLHDGNPDTDSTDYYGDTFEKLTPGMIWRGQPGDDIAAVGPNTPPADATAWVMMIERAIGIAMGLSRSELLQTTGDSSFSAVRAEANMDRKRFRRMQRAAIYHLSEPTWERFVDACVLAGLPMFPSPSEYAGDVDAYRSANWRPPGWASVTPKEDAQADEINLRIRTDTREGIIGRRGGDWEDSFDQSEREERELEEARAGRRRPGGPRQPEQRLRRRSPKQPTAKQIRGRHGCPPERENTKSAASSRRP